MNGHVFTIQDIKTLVMPIVQKYKVRKYIYSTEKPSALIEELKKGSLYRELQKNN